MPARTLPRHFARRMLPLAALAAITVAAVPPISYDLIAMAKLRDQGRLYAGSIAAALGVAAERQPSLWRYNVAKVIQATAPHRKLKDIARVRITDCAGTTLFAPEHLAVGTGTGGGPAGWAAINRGGQAVAFVQVQMDPTDERQRLARIAAASCLIGLLLGLLLFLFPTRVVRRQAQALSETLEQLQLAEARLTQANRELSARVDAAVADVRSLSERVVGVQENERRRIARDLHDGVGQSLTALRIELELAQKSGETARLAEAARTCEEALSELRRVVRDLRPLELESGSLREALHALTERFELRTGVATSLRMSGEVRSEDTALCVLRILQEALTNVAKHAGAHEVGVTLAAAGGEVRLEVVDDGAGFDPAARSDGAGLPGVRERCAFLGGTVSIESAPGRGTTLRVRLPDREERKAS